MNKRLILLPLQARFLSEHFSDFLAKCYIPEGTPDAGIGAVLPGPSIPSSGKKKDHWQIQFLSRGSYTCVTHYTKYNRQLLGPVLLRTHTWVKMPSAGEKVQIAFNLHHHKLLPQCCIMSQH